MNNMSQNQPKRAIAVIPSDTINIPQPGAYLSGASSTNGTTLTTAGAKFIDGDSTIGRNNFVTAGDVVVSGTEIAQIVKVNSNTVLTLAAPGITAGAPNDYKIYRSNGGAINATQGTDGYSLFVGGAGDMSVVTVDGDEVVMKNIGNASFIPQQVIRVKAAGTTASDIIALD